LANWIGEVESDAENLQIGARMTFLPHRRKDTNTGSAEPRFALCAAF
jgi:hypothetical protein